MRMTIAICVTLSDLTSMASSLVMVAIAAIGTTVQLRHLAVLTPKVAVTHVVIIGNGDAWTVAEEITEL